MLDPDIFLPIAFTVMLAMFALMLIIGIPRGKRTQKTNEDIANKQAEQFKLVQRQIEVHGRQTAAIERIATALERRDE